MSAHPSSPARHPSVDAVRQLLARDARRRREQPSRSPSTPVAGRAAAADPAEDRRALWQSRLAAYTRARQR